MLHESVKRGRRGFFAIPPTGVNWELCTSTLLSLCSRGALQHLPAPAGLPGLFMDFFMDAANVWPPK